MTTNKKLIQLTIKDHKHSLKYLSNKGSILEDAIIFSDYKRFSVKHYNG